MKYRLVQDMHTDFMGGPWYVIQRWNEDGARSEWVHKDSGTEESMTRRMKQLQNPEQYRVVEEFTV